MIQRYAYMDANSKFQENQMNLLSMDIFEKPLTPLQRKNQKAILLKQSQKKQKDMKLEAELLLNHKKMSIQDLTETPHQDLKIESQKSRLNYISNDKPIKKSGV